MLVAYNSQVLNTVKSTLSKGIHIHSFGYTEISLVFLIEETSRKYGKQRLCIVNSVYTLESYAKVSLHQENLTISMKNYTL